MNLPKYSKFLIGLTLISIIFAIITVIIQSPKGTLQSEETQFAVADSGIVNKIMIKQKNKTLILTKNQNQWLVNNTYIADDLLIENIKNLIYKSKIIKPVSKDILTNIQEILKSESSEISYFEDNNLIKKVKFIADNQELIGLIDGFSNAYFVDFQVVGKVPFLSIISSELQNWRNRTIFNSAISSINQLNVTYNDSVYYSFSIRRGLNAFEIIGMSNPDSTKILAYLDLYKNVQIRRYCNDIEQYKKDSLNKINSTFIIELKDKLEKKSNKIWIYYKNNQKTDIYGLVGEKNELCVIKPRVFEYLLQKRYFFELKK